MTEHNDHHRTRRKAGLYAAFHRNPASKRAVERWANLRPDMHILDVG